MFGIGTGEIILILVIAMIVVGPEKMVEVSRSMGAMVAQFRQQSDSMTQEFREAFALQSGEDVAEAPSETVATASSALPAPGTHPQLPPPDSNGGPGHQEIPVAVSAALVDREIEVVPASHYCVRGDGEGSSAEIDADAAPTLIHVGETVPEDEDVEPVAIQEPVLILDDDIAPDSEG